MENSWKSRPSGLRFSIGVMGAASGPFDHHQMEPAMGLGKAIAGAGAVMVSGACPGLPYTAAAACKKAGGTVFGISPGLSYSEHLFKYGSPVRHHDFLVYTGSGLMGREIVNIRSSDIVVIIGGKSGTLGELAIAYDEGKLIGVLTGTGGISDAVEDILKACGKNTGARVLYEKNPDELVRRLVKVYQEEHFKMPCCFNEEDDHKSQLEGHDLDPVCGMLVPTGKGLTLKMEDKNYKFCGELCREVFNQHRGSFETETVD